MISDRVSQIVNGLFAISHLNEGAIQVLCYQFSTLIFEFFTIKIIPTYRNVCQY